MRHAAAAAAFFLLNIRKLYAKTTNSFYNKKNDNTYNIMESTWLEERQPSSGMRSIADTHQLSDAERNFSTGSTTDGR